MGQWAIQHEILLLILWNAWLHVCTTNSLPLLPHSKTLAIFFLSLVPFLVASHFTQTCQCQPLLCWVSTKITARLKALYQQPCRIQGHDCNTCPKRPTDRECSGGWRRSDLWHWTFCSCEEMGHAWLRQSPKFSCEKNHTNKFHMFCFVLFCFSNDWLALSGRIFLRQNKPNDKLTPTAWDRLFVGKPATPSLAAPEASSHSCLRTLKCNFLETKFHHWKSAPWLVLVLCHSWFYLQTTTWM